MAKVATGGKLGVVDVIVGAVLFVLMVFLMRALLDTAVPGLLKTETMYHILVSGLLFFLVWGLIGNFVFGPYFDLMTQREQRTEGDTQLATEKRRESARLQAEIDEQLRLARLEGIRARDARVDEARKQAQQLVDRAQQEADAELKRAQAELERAATAARTEVSGQADSLAALVIDRALSVEPGQMVH